MARLTPISTLWFWRGLSGHSVTFASLFASVILGFSISKGMHHVLGVLGFGWVYVILIPILIFKLLAKAEARWIPDPKRRRTIALGILLGSLALSSGLRWLQSREALAGTPARASRAMRP